MLSPSQKDSIRTYKYNGQDHSLLYKYLLSPIAGWLVDNVTPEWIAPNLITFLGLTFNILALVMTLVYDPTLTDAPTWLPFLTGACLFIYQTLDNMDGKQARKVGASSPLGLLFDHGCDAITAGLTAIPLTSCFGAGWSVAGLFTCWLSAFLTFYVQTWEEFYLDEMILPIVNGPSEGLVMICTACCLSGINGCSWWQKPSIHVADGFALMYPHQLLLLQTLGIVLPAMVTQMGKVLIKLSTDTTVSSAKRAFNLKEALFSLLLLVTFVSCTFVWAWMSKRALPEAGGIFALYMGTVFFEIATHLMLMHTSQSPLDTVGRWTGWSAVLLPLNAFWGNYGNAAAKIASYLSWERFHYYIYVSNQHVEPGTQLTFILTPFVDEVLLMRVLCGAVVGFTWLQSYVTVHSIADALDVFIFKLGKKSLEVEKPATVMTTTATSRSSSRSRKVPAPKTKASVAAAAASPAAKKPAAAASRSRSKSPAAVRATRSSSRKRV